jgi:hypothetical protein
VVWIQGASPFALLVCHSLEKTVVVPIYSSASIVISFGFAFNSAARKKGNNKRAESLPLSARVFQMELALHR